MNRSAAGAVSLIVTVVPASSVGVQHLDPVSVAGGTQILMYMALAGRRRSRDGVVEIVRISAGRHIWRPG
ncbi:MAG TPA: hypothetical protein VN841_23190 [Bryobacteraceae bacterium]|nr:hypothetical protein [Bryobacteraceae bacterium]